MPVSVKSIQEELMVFGVDFEDNEVPDKLVELCSLHRLSEEGIVNEWMAFSATRLLEHLTVSNLNLLEHEVLNKKNVKRQSVKKDKHCGSRDFNSIQELIEVETEEENLLDSYSTPAKGSQKRNLSTPENPQSKRISSINRSPHLVFSPSTFSPSATPSQKYSSRGNRGEVVTSYGEVQGTSWSGGAGRNASVKSIASQEESLNKPYRYMFQKLTDIRDVVSSKIEELGEALKNHFHIEEFTSVSFPAQETVTVLGQIACDSNGKLNSKSVVLEGDREHSSGMYVPVDLSDLKEYSLFPGQVVVMEGTNSTGRKFVANKLYEGVPLPFYKPEEDLEESHPQMIITACGPFTTSDTIAYDALKDLVDVINRDRPDVCILLGPFLDAKHEQIETLQLTGMFEEVFKSCLKMIIEGTRLSGSHLVFVPSIRDVHHDPIYPQPPFSCYETTKEDKQRVHFVADPSTISVNGVAIGFTSTDLLFHMGAEEISSGTAGAPDRFSRILRQILNQRSYYPLYPPNEEINIDFEAMYNFAMMPVTPDVFIVPSELRFFIKDISGCICINPGRLTKGLVGGTYARLLVKRENTDTENRKSPCISAQVVKI
ncbi:PREDICTED: DNA polymerase alpha subunit B isoform X1 [Nanorana parkeri]|uniref:DNA polymerase alpha subunit B isoform X1 n=1 Tax=Nanorana parkeri TaxID=125878 RepID=UPI000854037D|nr:PREDICTED: DNA polymerase alpha subunit B isoform X1 [Nanorana parkeri]